jgi:hypothetical protein
MQLKPWVRCLSKYNRPLLALLSAWSVPAWADSLDTADSLINGTLAPLWNDSALALLDSTARPPSGLLQGWLLPAGVILLTATAVWLLYSVRSR